jgi:shikimate dehydrogenase
VNRTQAHAKKLAHAYQSLGQTNIHTASLDTLGDAALFKRAVLVVNSIPLGLHVVTFPPLDYGASPRGCLFYDLVYQSEPTLFLQRATQARRTTLDGRRMLLHQGALAFELWTQQPAPLRAMSRALSQALHGSS